MRGNLSYQIHRLFGAIDHRGESKRAVKRAFYSEVRHDKIRVKSGEISPDERIKGTISNLADRLGAYSNKAADDIRDEMLRLAEWTQERSGKSVNKFDITRDISPEDIKEFVRWRFSGGLNNTPPLERKTCQNITGHLLKYDKALVDYVASKGVTRDSQAAKIRAACREYLPEKSEKEVEYKNHVDPVKVLRTAERIARMSGNDNAYKAYLVSRILYDSGCRRDVATLISDKSITKIDVHTGVMNYKTKGGQSGSTQHGNALSAKTVDLVSRYIADHGELRIDDSTYNRWLHKAESAAGDRVIGAHSWRHDRVKETYNDCRDSGMPHDQAVMVVSEMLNHHRSDVAQGYIDRCDGIRS
jgi:integrase